MDLWEVDIARFEAAAANRRFLRERVTEAVGNQFAMHWPFKQMKTGRNVRRGPLHDALAAKGAVFGAAAGWERPFWYAADEDEAGFRYSYGDQAWWPAAAREARAMAEGVALLDLTPFGKFEVAGPDAEAFLQRLCANDVAVEPGHLVYSQLLNARGGIEADMTVTCLARDRYWLVGGAPTRQKDRAWLQRALGPR